MSMSPEEVEKPARIPDVATVMDRRRSASTLFSYFFRLVFIRLEKLEAGNKTKMH